MRRALVILAALAACAPGEPDVPTWADVQPILLANCVRCHGGDGLGGAPTQFRLDRFADTGASPTIFGAQTMGFYLAVRAADRGDMPPFGPKLSDRQKDILRAWGKGSAPLGERAGNRAPTATATVTAGDPASFVVTVVDPDGDVVYGTLFAGDLAVGELHGGTQELSLPTATLAPGGYPVRAELHDGFAAAAPALGTLVVAHARTAPSVTIVAPAADALFRDGGENRIRLQAPRGARVDVFAELGATSVRVAPTFTVTGDTTDLTWDPKDVAEGFAWRLRVVVTDRDGGSQALSPPFVVSHETTADRYADVADLVDGVCTACHNNQILGDFSSVAALRPLAGRAWKKLVPLLEMPPKSVIGAGGRELTADERARLGRWLHAGAP